MNGYRFLFGSVCWLFFVLSQQSGEKKVHPPAPAAAASYFFELVKNVFFYFKYLINHIQALCGRGGTVIFMSSPPLCKLLQKLLTFVSFAEVNLCRGYYPL